MKEDSKQGEGEKITMILRPGDLKVGENVLLIGVSSAHRGEAFEAARFLIDGIKQAASIQAQEIK